MSGRHLLAIPLALLVAAVATAPASAVIKPQRSIAGVKPGMSQQRVLDRLGSPRRTSTRLGGSGADDPITTYTYPRRGLKVYSHPNRANTVNVVFSIEVYRKGQRTPSGIGLGSRRSAVDRRVSGSKCRRYDPTYAICFVGRGTTGSITTTFWLNHRNRVYKIDLSRIIGD
ncbi:MAG TPA: hypothetical protein VH276_14920 [Solirubrobacteraceae bacterium]|nr:hypothetical protein [Solirubrobacteraceae bacterium]